MPLYLKSEKTQSLPGSTYYSGSLLGQWAKPTGIYIPPIVDIEQGVVNVLLYLHGWYVSGIEQLFSTDRAAIRQQVLASGKNVVLVAPYLGNGHKGAGATFSTSELKGHWGEMFLNQVLGALAPMMGPEKYKPAAFESNLSLSGLARVGKIDAGLRLGSLIIACHSGGGTGMRHLVGSLGRYKSKLAECWGFDCLYGTAGAPNNDDAGFWYNWVTGSGGRPLYISYGSSTVPQSVKLYLMGQGLATGDGARLDPKGAEVKRLDVKLGIKTAQNVNELMGLDALLAPAPGGQPLGNKFVEKAASNLKSKAGWPEDLMAMHYAIAKDGLLERLKASGL